MATAYALKVRLHKAAGPKFVHGRLHGDRAGLRSRLAGGGLIAMPVFQARLSSGDAHQGISRPRKGNA
jgi:hypothetical protein